MPMVSWLTTSPRQTAISFSSCSMVSNTVCAAFLTHCPAWVSTRGLSRWNSCTFSSASSFRMCWLRDCWEMNSFRAAALMVPSSQTVRKYLQVRKFILSPPRTIVPRTLCSYKFFLVGTSFFRVCNVSGIVVRLHQKGSDFIEFLYHLPIAKGVFLCQALNF